MSNFERNNPEEELKDQPYAQLREHAFAHLPHTAYQKIFEASFHALLLRIAPKLTPTERRVAYLIREAMRTCEIATTLGVTEHSVENYRVRIRRKLQLSQDESLSNYLSSIS